MSASILATPGDFMICTETYLSGVRTGTGLTQQVQLAILSVLRLAPTASNAVVPGTTRRATPVPRFGAGMSPPSTTSSWASASVSDQPASSGVSRREPPSRAEPARGATETERSAAENSRSTVGDLASNSVPLLAALPIYEGLGFFVLGEGFGLGIPIEFAS